LALVCLIGEHNFGKQGLIDYNFQCFREAIQEVFEDKYTTAKPASTSALEKIAYSESLDSTQSNGFNEPLKD